MVNVLSLDGGGIRGLIPALVLQYIEDGTGRPIAELFDLIVGTSTGGILALGLTVPEGEGRAAEPRYSAGDLAALYKKHGTDIFSRTWVQRIRSGFGYLGEKYDHDELVQVLDRYFGDQPVGAATADVMVSTYDIHSREPFFFKSWQDPDEHVPMQRAARATSAAPTYFEPALVSIGDRQRVLIDGGVFANHPGVSAYAEAKKRYPDEDIRVTSLGTGSCSEPYSYDETKDWGTLQWAVPIIDIVFDGISDAADYHLRHILGDRFERFQIPLTIASDALDDASRENLSRLEEEAERLMELRADDLAALIDRLDT